jgi:beta-galactosidase
VPWGNSHEGTLALVKHTPYISGQYIWTGFDYLGEPTPYGWPARSSYFGVVDLAGFPKDIYYLYQSEWRPDKTVLHLFPHWNWEEGQTVDMWAYYNNADEAELFINGVSQGIRRKLPAGSHTDEWRADVDMSTEFHVCWRVAYQPGVVEVVTRKDGAEVARKQIHTAGAPASIRLTPDRTRLLADGRDLSFVTVEVVDADGNLCPWAEDDIQFSVTGHAFIAGVDNGSQTSMERFKDNHRKAFYGKCLVVLQSDGKSGKATLTATANGLNKAKMNLVFSD